MDTKYQRQFEINRTELEIIETALREQAKQLSEKMLDHQASPKQDAACNTGPLNSRIKAVQSVLGNLHNQKVWYRPQSHAPLG